MVHCMCFMYTLVDILSCNRPSHIVYVRITFFCGESEVPIVGDGGRIATGLNYRMEDKKCNGMHLILRETRKWS